MKSKAPWLFHPCAELRERRLAAKLTQQQLAQVIGIRQSNVSKWERLQTWPRGANYERVSKWLDAARAAERAS